MTLDPKRRALIGRMAANRRWAFEPDRTAATAPARAGMDKRFEDQVDPDRILTPQERAKRVTNLKRAHFSELALKSAKARKAKTQAEVQ